jgi:hypothetical protein
MQNREMYRGKRHVSHLEPELRWLVGMTNDTRELLGRTCIRHQVLPYYILLDERPVGAPPVQRRIQKGFDVDLYGAPRNGELHLDSGYEYLHSTLEDLKTLAEQILPKNANSSEIELIPFDGSLDTDPAQHLKAEVLLRIRISRSGSLDLPAGPPEEQVLHEVTEKLEALQHARSIGSQRVSQSC